MGYSEDDQGRRSRGFRGVGGMCTSAFLPSPGIFEVHNGTHITHIPQNSPPHCSAPPLFSRVAHFYLVNRQSLSDLQISKRFKKLKLFGIEIIFIFFF